MTKTIIIGYGNTLRRDDGAGVAAAETLARVHPEANVMTAKGLYPELAERVAACEMAVFLDASARTSNVCVTRLTPESTIHGAGGHALSPGEVLGLCCEMYAGAPRVAMLVEIPAFEWGFGETMSARTCMMVDRCVQLISELLRGETTPEILAHLTPSPAID